MKIQNDIKLLVNPEILSKLIKCVEKAFPSEACGLIFGNILEVPNEQQENDYYYHYICRKFRCISPDKSSSVFFLIENEELLHDIIMKETCEGQEYKDMRLISIFHSHPKGTFPSFSDMDQMRYLDYFSSIKHNYGNKAFKNLIWVIMDSVNHNMNGFIDFEREIQQVKILMRKS
ncbi:MAG: Mov34/MPN/PAD-1 family protein [Candidatus Lokiarchaeota archaeon]|nr:Mov34/MPN/PAD-1 family protein [Candidatus Lokiarchaeota archaeon]